MIAIDHIALFTNDLERLKQFYIKYFCAVANDKYHNSKTGLETYFLTFEDSSRLEIMSKPALSDCEKSNRTGYIHLAFKLGSKNKVDELTNRLKNDGYTLLSGPRTTGDGYYESLFLDPDCNEIELTE